MGRTGKGVGLGAHTTLVLCGQAVIGSGVVGAGVGAGAGAATGAGAGVCTGAGVGVVTDAVTAATSSGGQSPQAVRARAAKRVISRRLMQEQALPR